MTELIDAVFLALVAIAGGYALVHAWLWIVRRARR